MLGEQQHDHMLGRALRDKLTLIKMLLKFPHTTVLSPSPTPVIYAAGMKC